MDGETRGVMEGRVVLVTGAGQGSGRGVALAFAAEGADVALIGRTASKLEAVADEIRAAGTPARSSATLVAASDISDPAQIDDAVDRTVERFGRIDVLVNTAHSTSRQGRLLKMADEEIEALWTSGPRATLRFMRRCHPHLVGGGSIVNFGSGTQMAPDGYGVYAAMKDAICAISRAAAVEWGPDQIRVNVLAPLAASPSMDSDTARRGGQEGVRARVPLGRIGDPQADIGRVAVFLAGPDASYITGQLLLVDGGMLYHR